MPCELPTALPRAMNNSWKFRLRTLAAGEGVEPSSSRSKSEVLPVTLSRNLLVDPTGLKPAPHGLKGRRSVARAPGQKWLWRKDSNPRMAALTVRCLTNLATPQSGGCGWIRTTNLALMRRLLYPLELHSRLKLEARGGVEPRGLSAQLFGLEDRRRERGPLWWTGREADAPLQLHGPGQSAFCRDESRPEKRFGGRSWNRTNLSGFSDPR